MLSRTLFDSDHELFRESIRTFVAKEIVPNADGWEQAGVVDKAMFRQAGASGFLGMEIPDEYGGGGVDDFRSTLSVGFTTTIEPSRSSRRHAVSLRFVRSIRAQRPPLRSANRR